MKISELPLAGVSLLELTPHHDDRGFFARLFCREEFSEAGLNPSLPQINLSYNAIKGTLRGLHFQRAPFVETKVVRCIQGAIYDVVVDLRKQSPTWGHWLGMELSAENRSALYIPAGFAHGFQTLADRSEVLYLMGEAYAPHAAAGLRYDDPLIGITWPLPVAAVSERDRGYPALKHGDYA